MQFNDTIPSGFPDTSGFAVDATSVCPEGQIIVNGMCAQCSVGTRYVSATQTCEQCPLGEYQDQPGQSACVACPSGFTTELPGTQSIDDCAEGWCLLHKLGVTDALVYKELYK